MENWTQLPAWLRYGIALALVGSAVALLMFANPVPLRLVGLLFVFGVIAFAVGPSDSDDNGYNF